MKTTLRSLLPVLTAALLLTACEKEPSNSVDQTRIRTDYELFYDKNTNKTTAIAAFRFGASITGTLLELSSPAEVRFNNEVLPFNSILARYEKEYPGFVSTGTFAYKDVNGAVLTNTMPAVKPIDFPASPATLTIGKGQEYLLTWEGSALAQGDGVGLSFAYGIFTETTLNATRVRLTPAQLQPLPLGATVGAMERWNFSDLQQQTASGGFLKGTYRTTNKNIQVVD